MPKKNKREHPRITFQGSVRIQFKGKEYPKCSAQNLSMVGMWVLGCQDQRTGNSCDIEFHDAGKAAIRPLRLKGEVVRVEEEGVALLFVDMNVRSYNDLETLIQAHADDSLQEEDDFLDEITEGESTQA